MENNSSLAPVLLVVGLAFLVPLILSRFKRLRLPVVVGEIIAGMVIGRSGIQLDDRLTLAGAITAVQEAAFLLGSR